MPACIGSSVRFECVSEEKLYFFFACMCSTLSCIGRSVRFECVSEKKLYFFFAFMCSTLSCCLYVYILQARYQTSLDQIICCLGIGRTAIDIPDI